jgi:hypothetical protein
MESLWDAVKHQENEAPKTNGAGNSASSQSEDANSSPRANPKPQNSKPQNSKMAASYSR